MSRRFGHLGRVIYVSNHCPPMGTAVVEAASTSRIRTNMVVMGLVAFGIAAFGASTFLWVNGNLLQRAVFAGCPAGMIAGWLMFTRARDPKLLDLGVQLADAAIFVQTITLALVAWLRRAELGTRALVALSVAAVVGAGLVVYWRRYERARARKADQN